MIVKIVSLDPTRHLHPKAVITSLGVIVDQHSAQKQNGETNKYAPNEKKKRKSTRKSLK